MADNKGDGAGLSATDLTELAESFQTISDTFRRLAVEQAKREKEADKVGAGKGNG
jgi:hypothetical protein